MSGHLAWDGSSVRPYYWQGHYRLSYPCLGKGQNRGNAVARTRDQAGEQHPLQSDRETTTIRDAVVVSIVSVAAQEVEGVQMSHGGTRLPGDNSPTIGEFVGGITGGGSRPRGISVEVGERQAAVDLTVNVTYGKSIPQVTEAVRRNVISRVENLTGLELTEVNISVNDLTLPEP